MAESAVSLTFLREREREREGERERKVCAGRIPAQIPTCK